MIDAKINFSGGLDLDDSLSQVPPVCYVDALNITRATIVANNNGEINNIKGTSKVSFDYPDGIGKVIGKFPCLVRNSIIFFRWNENSNHGVYEYDRSLGVISKIFENLTDSGGIDVLGFLKDVKITSVNVLIRDEGDLLFFLDCLGRPTQMDIKLFKEGYYTPVTRDILDKCKKPPLIPPTVLYGNDSSFVSNDLLKRLFRFKFRYIYDDYEKSVFSPISKVPLPKNILDNTYTNIITNNNVIQLGLNTGDKNVKSIELAVSFVNGTNDWSDFQSVDVIKKTDLYFSAETTSVPIGGGSMSVTTVFTGVVQEGVVINIYLKNISTTDMVLVGTYTTIDGDTLDSITTALTASMAGIGISVPSNHLSNILFYFYDSTVYSFDNSYVEITGNIGIDNLDFVTMFHNDSSYPNIDINESIQLFDYVPDVAWAQDLLNGDVLGYSNITEGFNKDTTPSSIITVGTIPATNSVGGGSLNAILFATSDTRFHQVARYDFSGIPAVGTIVKVKARLKSSGAVVVVSDYTTVAGDTAYIVVTNLLNTFCTRIVPQGIDVQVEKSTYIPISGTLYVTVEITPPPTSTANNSIPTWKPYTSRVIARAYFDQHGKTNGILYTDKVVFPAYAENSSFVPLLPYINYKINDIPPSYAYSFGFYFNKIATTWIYWQTNSVIMPAEPYIYFEVTDFITNATTFPTNAAVCSYTFKDGDRMRIIRDMSDNSVPGSAYDNPILGLIVDPIIDGAVTTPAGRQFIKINKVEPFASYVNATHNYVLELYSPEQQLSDGDNQVFYECGRQYNILNPTLPNRAHGGEVADQVPGVTPAEYNFYDGDAYFRPRTIAISTSSIEQFNVFDANFVDSYISAVSSIDGRANIIDINARKQTFPTLIRFGQAYQQDTNVNGLSRFYPNNFDEYDYTFGAVVRLRVRDRYLKVFQQFKIGIVPLYGQITKDASGNETLIVTDKLLNPIQYRAANFGLSSATSLASYFYADYGCDAYLGIIWRDSNDGTIPISRLYKLDSWAKTELPLRKNDSHIYGAFYPNTNNYIIALEQAPPSCATILFVSGNTVATPISCATISEVNGFTQNTAPDCGEISSVQGDTTNSAQFLIQNNTAAASTIDSLDPAVFTYDSGVQDFPLAAGEEIVGQHSGFSASFNIAITTTEYVTLSVYVSGSLYYSRTVAVSDTFVLLCPPVTTEPVKITMS